MTELVIAILANLIGGLFAGLLLKLIEKRTPPQATEQRSVVSLHSMVQELSVSYHVHAPEKPQKEEDATSILIVFVFLAFVVLGFLKANLRIVFLVAHGFAFFGLGFSLITLLAYIFSKARVQLSAWGEGLLRLAIWAGATGTIFLIRSSTFEMEFFTLGDVAQPLALAALLVSMVFFLLTDISSVWCVFAFINNRWPPRPIRYWWKGRWFLYLTAFILLAMSFSIATGLIECVSH